ncbi:zf-TFIIB domain-containing protein [Sphingomonas lenta]|uniref:zf-TFIIB domain-containing protein n=1 Tax=Sphingomonas lenta TaxID=1141887 RepID=UPI001140E426|nr:zf-TFIIB domain-containing protein [Sphingomonas lenta]
MSKAAAPCPACGAPLAPGARHGRAILRCDACSASWVDDSHLGAIALELWRAGAERRRLRAKWLIGGLAA